MKDAVIVSAVRTAVGSFGGSLKDVPATRLGALVIEEALKRAGTKPDQVDEAVMGCVLQAGLGLNPARQAAMGAGIGKETPSFTVNEVCGSGLKAVNLAAQAIQAGEAEILVAGGMESMSRAPYLLEDIRWGKKMGGDFLVDDLLRDGLWCPFEDTHMGMTAENIASKYEIGRQEQDEFAVGSQEKAIEAIDNGRFREEIVPVEVPQPKGAEVVFEVDEHPRRGVTVEKLSKLKPAFKRDGTVTAGNASGINDSAAALVVMAKEKADSLGIEPMARVRAYASVGVDPAFMGLGPVPATGKVLQKAGLELGDIELIEVNEAFSVQTLAVIRELGLDTDKLNPNGGAVALGHPVGASGARILVTLLFEMKRRGSKLGLATLCIGGGGGIATIVEILP